MTGGHQHQEMAAVEHEIEVASQRTFESPIDFRDQLKEIYKAYPLLVEALVNTDLMEARQSASRLLNIINQVDANGLHGEAGDQWTRDRDILASAIGSMIDQSRLTGIRKTLPLLSDQLYQTLVKFQVETGAYRMFCPMAFGSHGAFWLSDGKEIRNPYLSEQMQTCGNIYEKLK
jgi:hypothetical protein